MMHEVLAVKQRVLGADHPETLMTASNLAASLSRQKKVLSKRRQVLGTGT
jgi:hypothetical protein